MISTWTGREVKCGQLGISYDMKCQHDISSSQTRMDLWCCWSLIAVTVVGVATQIYVPWAYAYHRPVLTTHLFAAVGKQGFILLREAWRRSVKIRCYLMFPQRGLLLLCLVTSSCLTLATLQTVICQTLLSMGILGRESSGTEDPTEAQPPTLCGTGHIAAWGERWQFNERLPRCLGSLNMGLLRAALACLIASFSPYCLALPLIYSPYPPQINIPRLLVTDLINAWVRERQKKKWLTIASLSQTTAAATAKSLQSCPTLCDPIHGSPPGSPVPGVLQARTLEWVAISFSNAWKRKVKVKSLSRVQPLATPWTAAYQVPPSMGFSRQEYWSGLPLPSPFIMYRKHQYLYWLFV